MYKRIKDSVGSRTCSSSGCIRAKDGITIMEKEKILERWSQYIEELFEDDRKGKPSISKPIDGPKILKSEVRAAMNKMKKNKAAGPDDVTVEQLTILDEFGIDKITDNEPDL